MNKHYYRVIFNKNLARMVVVSETTPSQGKSSEPSDSNLHTVPSIAQSQHGQALD